MKIILKALGVIILAPIGLAGILFAFGSFLAGCGYQNPSFFDPIGTFNLGSIASYIGTMIGSLVAYGSYMGIKYLFEGKFGDENHN